MKIDCQLDYQTVLAAQARPVHAVIRLSADKRSTARKAPLNLCAVLDRSGSMRGAPLDHARKACEMVVRHLGKEDSFGLVVFDSEAQVVFPLQPVTDKAALLGQIRRIQTGGSTNLTAGWMLGRDELKKAAKETPRQVLLLSDGQLNNGIVEPNQVAKIVSSGVECDRVRTTSLGFGDGYNEDLLRQLAKVSGGDFFDADSPEKLPIIFREVLQGLQETSAQNVRVRLKPSDFCEELAQLGDYPVTSLPDNRIVFCNPKNANGPLAPRTAWERRNGLFAPVEDFEFESFDDAEGTRVGVSLEELGSVFENGALIQDHACLRLAWRAAELFRKPNPSSSTPSNTVKRVVIYVVSRD